MTEVASKVGDKLESTADKIAGKIPGGEHLKEMTSSVVEKSVNTIGDTTKGMVQQGKDMVTKKVEEGQAAAEKKTGSLLGEITDKIQEAASKTGEMLGSGVAQVQDVAQQ